MPKGDLESLVYFTGAYRDRSQTEGKDVWFCHMGPNVSEFGGVGGWFSEEQVKEFHKNSSHADRPLQVTKVTLYQYIVHEDDIE